MNITPKTTIITPEIPAVEETTFTVELTAKELGILGGFGGFGGTMTDALSRTAENSRRFARTDRRGSVLLLNEFWEAAEDNNIPVLIPTKE